MRRVVSWLAGSTCLAGLIALGIGVGAPHSTPPQPVPPVKYLATPGLSAAPAKQSPVVQRADVAAATPRPVTVLPPSIESLPPQKSGEKQEGAVVAKPPKELLTAAAVAALIIAASRSAYHATGRPCACPDDRMRNGRACGGRSAYSRPGGAAPLCYAHDVTASMVDEYRKRVASR